MSKDRGMTLSHNLGVCKGKMNRLYQSRGAIPALAAVLFVTILACRTSNLFIAFATATPPPTRIPRPTITRGPTETPVPTETSTPSPTANPTQAADSNSLSPSQAVTLTRPSAGPEGYRLKAWTEEDAKAAITEAKDMLAKPDYTDGFYDEDAARLYLTAIMRETFVRLPATKNEDWIIWDFIREEVNREFGYERGALADGMLRLLENTLNSGQVDLADLGNWLDARGFSMISRHPAHNFYGDGQKGVLLQIEIPRFLFRSDLLAIVEGSRQGEYRVTSVRHNWRSILPLEGDEEEIAVKDHTGNGIPEISSVSGRFGHATCFLDLELYEWRGDRSGGHFENIAKDVLGTWGDYYDRNCIGVWEFGAPDSKRAQRLFVILQTHNPIGEPCWGYEFRVRYEWNGEQYKWASGDAVPPYPRQPSKCLAGWAFGAADHSLYDQAIPLVVSTLADWQPELDKVWGTSAKDYFRFKLGTWYAFNEQYDLAVATLLDVRDNPANRDYDMVSRMADVFLARYRVLNHADEACDAVVRFVNAEIDRIPRADPTFLGTETVIPRLGFYEPNWKYHGIPFISEICMRGRRVDVPEPPRTPTYVPHEAPLLEPSTEPSEWELEVQFRDRIELIEETLFTKGDAQEAAQLAGRLLADPIRAKTYKGSKEIKPHILYLLAVSSELSSDEAGAVASYWQIWQEFPSGHYAAAARHKLEQIAQ